MRAFVLVVLCLALCACSSSALYFAKAAPDGVEGMRVELKGGTFSGGVEGDLKNVGEFVKVPNAYRGPVPPGWVVYEGGYPLPVPNGETPAAPPTD
jgi:hypothetical protein